MAESMFSNMYDARQKDLEGAVDYGTSLAALPRGRVSVAVAGQSGGMLGQGLSSLAGALPPEQAQQAKIDELMSRFPNPTTYEDYMAIAGEFMTSGMQDMGEYFLKLANDMKTKATKPSAFAEKIAFINGMDISDAEKAEMRKKVAGGSGTTINMGAGDTAYDKEAGKIAAKTDKDLVELATITATASLDKTGEVLDILETGEASTGMFAGLDLVKNRFLSVFGNEEARKSATKTQVLEAFLGSDVFPMIKALGIGARGLDTPAEREFLINVMTGAKEMNKEAIIKLTELRRGINESVVEKYNKRLADGGLDRFQKAYGRPLEPIKLKFRPPSSAISGVINGTKVFKLTNGEYVDAYGKPFKLNKGK